MGNRRYASKDSKRYKAYKAQESKRREVALSHTLADENNIELTDEVGRKLVEEYK